MLGYEKNWVIAFVLVSIILIAGCGKNDPFVPFSQAPAPVGNPYYNPNGYNPTNYPNYYPQGNQQYYPNPSQYAPGYQPGGGYPSPYFAPQVPPWAVESVHPISTYRQLHATLAPASKLLGSILGRLAESLPTDWTQPLRLRLFLDASTAPNVGRARSIGICTDPSITSFTPGYSPGFRLA